jgi:MFS family permease
VSGTGHWLQTDTSTQMHLGKHAQAGTLAATAGSTAVPAHPATPVRLLALVVLTATSFSAARVTGSLYLLSHEASVALVGLLMALFSLLPMLLALRTGRWLDATGPRRPLVTGGAIMALGLLLPAAMPFASAGLPLMAASALLIGGGFLYVQMALQHLIGLRAAPDQRAAAFSHLALCFSLSGVIAPVLAGLLIDEFGHRGTYIAVLTLMLGMLPALLGRPDSAAGISHPAPAVRPRTMDLLRLPSLRRILLASALVSMSWDLQAFMLPVYGTRIGMPASQIGLILGCFAVATLLIRLAMPWLVRRWREWQLLAFTLLTAALAFGLMPWASTPLSMAACTFLLGLGLGCAQPNVMSLLHSASPAGRAGEVLGLRTAMMNASHVFLPLLFGTLGAVAGPGPVFWSAAAMLAAGGWMCAARHWPRRTLQTPDD